MIRRRRTPALSDEEREALGIGARERILGVATVSGGHAVATSEALYAAGERLAWPSIAHAEWADPYLDVDLDDGLRKRRLRLDLLDAGQLPAAVRVQVTDSVVTQRRLDLGNGRGALAVARRTSEGGIAWSVLFDAGLDPGDPSLRGRADAALGELRDALGI